MDNSDSIRQWCNAGRKNCEGRSSVGEITWVGVGSRSKVSKTSARRRMNASSVRRSQRIFKENALKFRDSCGKLRLPVQCSRMEIEPFTNAADCDTNSTRSPISVMYELGLSSDTNSDTVSNRPHQDLAPGSSYFSITGGISVQNPVFDQKFQRKRTKLKVCRRGQKGAIEQDTACIYEGSINSSWQFSPCNGETSVKTSSCGSISEVADEMHLQSWVMNGQIRNPSPVEEQESSYTSKGLTGNPKDLNSEAYRRPSYAVKDQEGASEIAFEGLHVLADAAIWKLENDQADDCPERTEGRASSQQWIRKTIFFLTGVPFLQKRVIRRARSAYRSKDDCPGALQMHGTQNLNPAISEPLMSDNALSKLGETPALDQAAGRPKRTRLQTLPAKYSNSVLQPWKRGARR